MMPIGSARLLLLRGEQVAHGQAAIRPPPVRQIEQLYRGGNVVETVDPLDRATQCDIAREKDVWAVQRDEQETVRRPRPDALHRGQGCLDLFVCHAFKRRIAQPPVDESLRQRPERLALASREPGGTKYLRIGCQQLGRRRQMIAESLFDAGHDRAGRSDRQLLADDLENQCPERIERRELVHPRSGTKGWMRVDDAREHRIGLAKELASPSVDEPSGPTRTSTHAQALSRRSRTSGRSTTHSLVGSAYDLWLGIALTQRPSSTRWTMRRRSCSL